MKSETTTKRTKLALLGAMYCLVGMLAGCTEKHNGYKEMASQIPAVQPGYGRIYLYVVKGSPFDAFHFFVGATDSGKVQGNQYLYVDEPAGTHIINVDIQGTTLTEHISVKLAAGDTRYIQVRREVSLSGRVYFVQMDPRQAMLDLEQCQYAGPYASGPPAK